jgi:hypothetical protein
MEAIVAQQHLRNPHKIHYKRTKKRRENKAFSESNPHRDQQE